MYIRHGYAEVRFLFRPRGALSFTRGWFIGVRGVQKRVRSTRETLARFLTATVVR